MRAAQNGHVECVQLLVHGGALRQMRDANGRTARDLAGATEHNIATFMIRFNSLYNILLNPGLI
jgi:hypothetical protein